MGIVLATYKPGIDPAARNAFLSEQDLTTRREMSDPARLIVDEPTLKFNRILSPKEASTVNEALEGLYSKGFNDGAEAASSPRHSDTLNNFAESLEGSVEEVEIITAVCPTCRRIKPVNTANFNYLCTTDGEGFDRVCKVCRCASDLQKALSESAMTMGQSVAQKQLVSALNEVAIENMYSRRIEPAKRKEKRHGKRSKGCK